MAKTGKPPFAVTGDSAAIAATGSTGPAVVSPRKERGKKLEPGRKLTLHLPLELDFRLDNLALFLRMHKSGFALKLLEQGCRSYGADKNLKKVFAEISGQAGETVNESAA
jgi:hypothetical protein